MSGRLLVALLLLSPSASATSTHMDAPPAADFTFAPAAPKVTEQVTFSDASSDPDGPTDMDMWMWDFGDGSIPHIAYRNDSVTHVYNVDGTFTATLQVTDRGGAVGEKRKEIAVAALGPRPSVVATDPADGQTGVPMNANITITFNVPMDIGRFQGGAVVFDPSVSHSAEYGDNGKAKSVVVLDPSWDLFGSNQRYVVTVTTLARSSAGMPLPVEFTFNFTTSSARDKTPPTVLHTPPSPVAAGASLTFAAEVRDDSYVSWVRLHHRRSGEVDFTTVAMALDPADGKWRATLAGAAVAAPAVEYYIEASDVTGKRTTAPTGGASSPNSVQVTEKGGTIVNGSSGGLVLGLAIGLAIAVVVAVALLLMRGKKKAESLRQPGQRGPSSPR